MGQVSAEFFSNGNLLSGSADTIFFYRSIRRGDKAKACDENIWIGHESHIGYV
jgi:hypothetical protein